ncbi:MAG: hypothetical protein PWQ82_1690 [Thermosediminibacterales bacterium]|nr:hypothetical protein [Thermosediminibacterales bacterium]MDK2836667.1 hypothetical protein [Thermosediminibacterales bacterium]
MRNKKKFLIMFLVAAVLIGVGITYYYHYQSVNYVTTEDARIEADTVVVTPQIPGKILSWDVKEGDYVKKGEKLGLLDLSSIMNTANVNVQALNELGSPAASKAEITAPISGRVIKSNVRAGQTITPGQTMAIIADTDDMYVTANIEETKISKVKMGQKVEIKIDAIPEKKFIGYVSEIGEATTSYFSLIPIQNSNGNFTKVTQLIPIKIRFPEINKLNIVPGMNVVVKIHISD